MIYNSKCIFGLHPISGTELLKPLNFQSDQSHKGVFCYVIEVVLEWGLVASAASPVMRGLEFLV